MAEKDRDEEETKRRKEEDEEEDQSKKSPARDDEEEHEEAEEKEAAAEKEDSEEKEAPPKRAAKGAEDSEVEKKTSKGPTPKKAGSRDTARRSARRPPPKGGSLGKSMMLFVLIIGPLSIAAVLFGREDQHGTAAVAAPKWSVGQTVDVEITVVPSDKNDLACASKDKIGDRRCQFEAPGKAVEGATDDKQVLKPYTTTDRVQFAAAGLWAEPALAPGKIPPSRFSVKCKYTVEGKFKPHIRWNTEGPWYPQEKDWYAGAVSNCNVVPPG